MRNTHRWLIYKSHRNRRVGEVKTLMQRIGNPSAIHDSPPDESIASSQFGRLKVQIRASVRFLGTNWSPGGSAQQYQGSVRYGTEALETRSGSSSKGVAKRPAI